MIFGREDRFLNLFAMLARLLPVIAWPRPQARFQPIFVEDVARVMTACLPDPHSFGQSYVRVRAQDLHPARTGGIRMPHSWACSRPIIELNEWLSLLQAAMLERLPGTLMTRDNIYSMRVDNVCGSALPSSSASAPRRWKRWSPSTWLARHPGRAIAGFGSGRDAE